MSILTEAVPVTYNCDGVNKDFAIPFVYLDDTYVWVRHKNGTTLDVTTLVITTDYTVALDTITTASTYPTGDQITLSLLIPITQLVDLEKNGRLDNDLLDTVHDKLTLISQALKLDNDSIVGLEVPENPVPSMKLPDAATRASSYLAFDSSGNIIVVSAIETGTVTITVYGEALINAADASAARALLDTYSKAEVDTEIDTDISALAGVGHTTETVADNQSDILELAGAGRSTETVKGNADGLSSLSISADIESLTVGGINYKNIGEWAQVGTTWTFPLEGGSTRMCALSPTRIVVSVFSVGLNVYDFDGTTWTQVGNSLTGSWGNVSIATLSSTTFAMTDATSDTLRTYSFDGTDITLVGNALSWVSSQVRICAVAPDTIATYDQQADVLQSYTFDGTDWATKGSTTSITNAGFVDALTETRIVYADFIGLDLTTYEFNGTSWVATGSVASLSGVSDVCVLSTDLIAVFDSLTSYDVTLYQWSGSAWATVGNTFSIDAVSNLCATALLPNRIVYIDVDETSKVFEFEWVDPPPGLSIMVE